MKTTTKALRIRFAEARGWINIYRATNREPFGVTPDGEDVRILPAIDANHVREALMGMTEEEWRSFSEKLYSLLRPATTISVIEQILKTQPSTLAELYCEMKGVK